MQHVERALRKFCVKFQEIVERDLNAHQRLGMTMRSFPDCGSFIDIQVSKKSRSWKLASCPTTLTLPKSILWLISRTPRRMTGELGVMVEHRNSPFVFCNPGFQWLFSLTAVLKIAVGAVQLILYTVSNFDQSTFSWAFCRGNKLFTVLNGLKATLIFVAWRFD